MVLQIREGEFLQLQRGKRFTLFLTVTENVRNLAFMAANLVLWILATNQKLIVDAKPFHDDIALGLGAYSTGLCILDSSTTAATEEAGLLTIEPSCSSSTGLGVGPSNQA